MRTFLAIAALAAIAIPCSAIVINTGDPNSLNWTYGTAVHGVNLSGVVEVISGAGYCSGSLLSDGVSILTAGHCINDLNPVGFTVKFMTSSGLVAQGVSSVVIDPDWNGDFKTGSDLAVLHLASAAPAGATRYNLFTGEPDITSAVNVLAGYGYAGTGASGFDPSTGFDVLRAGTNQYGSSGSRFGDDGTLLLAQIYNPANTRTNILNERSPYSSLSDPEHDAAGLAPGDSGGPTFQNGLLVGVHHQLGCRNLFEVALCDTPNHPLVDGSFGQYFEDTNVSTNIVWITEQLVPSEAPEPGAAALMLAGIMTLWLSRLRAARAFVQAKQPVRGDVRPDLDRS